MTPGPMQRANPLDADAAPARDEVNRDRAAYALELGGDRLGLGLEVGLREEDHRLRAALERERHVALEDERVELLPERRGDEDDVDVRGDDLLAHRPDPGVRRRAPHERRPAREHGLDRRRFRRARPSRRRPGSPPVRTLVGAAVRRAPAPRPAPSGRRTRHGAGPRRVRAQAVAPVRLERGLPRVVPAERSSEMHARGPIVPASLGECVGERASIVGAENVKPASSSRAGSARWPSSSTSSPFSPNSSLDREARERGATVGRWSARPSAFVNCALVTGFGEARLTGPASRSPATRTGTRRRRRRARPSSTTAARFRRGRPDRA